MHKIKKYIYALLFSAIPYSLVLFFMVLTYLRLTGNIEYMFTLELFNIIDVKSIGIYLVAGYLGIFLYFLKELIKKDE